MEQTQAETDFTQALDTLADEPERFVPSLPFWLRVWHRARRETGHYTIEVFTGLAGSSGLALVVIAGLYWAFGGWADARGYVVTIVYIATGVFICSFAFLFVRLVRLPPIMERETILADRQLIQELARAYKDQSFELQRLSVLLTRQANDNLSILVHEDGRDSLLAVLNHGPDATVTATCKIIYTSRPQEPIPEPFLLFWDHRRESSVRLGTNAHADVVLVGCDETHVFLYEWSAQGPNPVGNWYLNGALVSKDPASDWRYVELWIEVTFSYDAPGVDPLVARYVLDATARSSHVRIVRVTEFEQPPTLGAP